MRTIRRFQINDKRLYRAFHVSKLILFLYVSILNDGMLFRTRGVINGDIRHQPVSTEQIRALTLYVQQFDLFTTLKNIQAPTQNGFTSFRGFIVHKDLPCGQVEKTLFLFFEHVAGTQLKQGLITLIELASECFGCERLVICLARNAEGLQGLVRDLGWVGFELVTLAHWIPQHDIPKAFGSSIRSGSFSSVSTSSSVFPEDDVTSEKWLFMGMEL